MSLIDSPSMVIDEKQSDTADDMEDEVVPATTTDTPLVTMVNY